MALQFFRSCLICRSLYIATYYKSIPEADGHIILIQQREESVSERGEIIKPDGPTSRSTSSTCLEQPWNIIQKCSIGTCLSRSRAFVLAQSCLNKTHCASFRGATVQRFYSKLRRKPSQGARPPSPSESEELQAAEQVEPSGPCRGFSRIPRSFSDVLSAYIWF